MMQLVMMNLRFHDSERKACCRREEYLPVFATDLGFSAFYNIYKKQKALIALDWFYVKCYFLNAIKRKANLIRNQP